MKKKKLHPANPDFWKTTNPPHHIQVTVKDLNNGVWIFKSKLITSESIDMKMKSQLAAIKSVRKKKAPPTRIQRPKKGGGYNRKKSIIHSMHTNWNDPFWNW